MRSRPTRVRVRRSSVQSSAGTAIIMTQGAAAISPTRSYPRAVHLGGFAPHASTAAWNMCLVERLMKYRAALRSASHAMRRALSVFRRSRGSRGQSRFLVRATWIGRIQTARRLALDAPEDGEVIIEKLAAGRTITTKVGTPIGAAFVFRDGGRSDACRAPSGEATPFGGLSTSSDSRRGPLTRNLREECANSDLSIARRRRA